jgi:hypothetical protein
MKADSNSATGTYEIVKTRDRYLAHRTFMAMSREARNFLWNWLDVENRPDQDELPDRGTLTGNEFLWHELLRSVNGNGGHFFLVVERNPDEASQLFVSADWDGAQVFARSRTEERSEPEKSGDSQGGATGL